MDKCRHESPKTRHAGDLVFCELCRHEICPAHHERVHTDRFGVERDVVCDVLEHQRVQIGALQHNTHTINQ